MTDHPYEARGLVALDQIEDLLEAYADARLAPTGPVLARMRKHVMAQAAQMAAADAVARQLAEHASRPRFALPRFLPRRAVALGMAAAMTLGTSAAVLAAPPGSPFYNARVAIEVAFLPTQLDARLASHEQHLQDRIAEAEAAAARGDVVALEAALAAYDAEIESAFADLGDNANGLNHFEAAMASHVAKLQALAARLPNETASDNAVEHAITTSERVVERINEKKAHSGGKPSDKPGGPANPPGGGPNNAPGRN
jgi:hypothetical protein